MGGVELSCACGAEVAGGGDEEKLVAVVVHGGADVVPVGSMGRKRPSRAWVVVDDGRGADGRERRSIVVKRALHGVIGGEGRVAARCAQHVEGHFDLGEELAPQLKWAVGAHGDEADHEVILCCLDGRLGGIDSVVVRLDQLDPSFFFSNLVLMALEHSLLRIWSFGLHPCAVK